MKKAISIHALLAESDVVDAVIFAGPMLFLSTLSLRRATALQTGLTCGDGQFLSTLSLRRATVLALCSFGVAYDFYPRSPCGERPVVYDIVFMPG